MQEMDAKDIKQSLEKLNLPWEALRNGIDKIAIRKIAEAIDQPGVIDHLMGHFVAGLVAGFHCTSSLCVPCLYVLYYGRDKIGDKQLDSLAEHFVLNAVEINLMLEDWYDADIDGADIYGMCLERLIEVLGCHGVAIGRKILPRVLDEEYDIFEANALVWEPLAWLSFEATPEEKQQLIELCSDFLEYARNNKMDETAELVTATAILANLAPQMAAERIQEYLQVLPEKQPIKPEVSHILEKLEGKPKCDFIEPAGTGSDDFEKSFAGLMSQILEYRDHLKEQGYFDEDSESQGRGEYVHKNSPCPCGSDKKYKKCCGK